MALPGIIAIRVGLGAARKAGKWIAGPGAKKLGGKKGAKKGKQRIFGAGFHVLKNNPKAKMPSPGFSNLKGLTLKEQRRLTKAGDGGTGFIVDDTKFRAYLNQLRNQFTPPKTFWSVLESETLQVLQKSAQRTNRANLRKLAARYNPNSKYFNHIVRLDGKLYSMKNRYSNTLWARIVARNAFYKKRAEDRVGLSKAIFYKIAKDDLKLKNYSRGWKDAAIIKRSYNAQVKKGKGKPGTGRTRTKLSWARSGWGKRIKKNKRSIDLAWGLEGTTDTLNPYAKGAGAVYGAVNARVTHFRRALANNYFKDAKWVASRFPGIKTTQ